VSYPEDIPIYIPEGDSLLLDIEDMNHGGILPYMNYSWSPREGLSNPDSPITWCKPEKETNYHYTITDSAGCVGSSGHGYEVVVTSKTAIPSVTAKLFAYQWKENIYFNNPENQDARLSFYDPSGKLVFETVTKSDNYQAVFSGKGNLLFCTIRIADKQQTIKYFAQ
jgi:hypothetical protein